MQITSAGHDQLPDAGKGSGIDRGDCERLFQLLSSQDLLGERYERNGLGFTNAYVIEGKRAKLLFAGKLPLEMGFTKSAKKGAGASKDKAAPARRIIVNESFDRAEYGGEYMDELYDEREGVYDGAEEEWCVSAAHRAGLWLSY